MFFKLYRIFLASLLLATYVDAAALHPSSFSNHKRRADTDLNTLCAASNIASIVSNFTFLPTVSFDTNNLSAAIVTNYTSQPSAGGPFWRTKSGINFCNVTMTMSHINLDDSIALQYWLPDPSQYQNRFLSNGGGGWSVSGAGSLASGLAYGAVSGATDGGFGGQLSAQLLSSGGNGTIAWSRLESFAYQAIHEMTIIGKELTKAFYNTSANDLKAYYLGCSEGGREGHMLTQRYPSDVDGAVAAAPAMYFPVMQLAQGWPSIAMAQLNHFPDPCAFEAIQKDFIAACDPLDGKTDGVISRSDLCKYDALNSVGKKWTNCTASTGMGMMTGGNSTEGNPGIGASGSMSAESAQSTGTSGTSPQSSAPTSGTVSQLDAEVVNAIYKGAFDSKGNQIFYTYQPGTTLSVEASTQFNATTMSYEIADNHFFGTYYQNLVVKNTVAPTINYSSISVDDVFQLMLQGIQDYGSWTETTWPDLSEFQQNGGKLIHWHGGQDTNLYPQASAHFYEKVKNHMFPNGSYSDIQDFYRFAIVPGAAHCSINSAEPNGPFPQFAFEQLLDWVENGIAPEYINGTTESGSSVQDKICLWPTMPKWASDGSFSCVEISPSEFIAPLNGWKVDY